MASGEKEHDFEDVYAEEVTRGRKQPKKAISLAKLRTIRKIGNMLGDQRCDEATFRATIRDFGLKEGSPKFAELVRLFRKRHGGA